MLVVDAYETFHAAAIPAHPHTHTPTTFTHLTPCPHPPQDLIKSYLGNSIHLLGQMTEAAMLSFALRRLRASVVFLAPFERLQKKLLKLALTLFGSADNTPRVQAVLMLR